MVISILLNSGEVVCADGPEDDRGLHQRISRLCVAVCSARAATVVRDLNDVAFELGFIHLAADRECLTRCIARDHDGRGLARFIGRDRAEDDRACVEAGRYLGQIAFDGVEDLKRRVAEPIDLTYMGRKEIDSDLLCDGA